MSNKSPTIKDIAQACGVSEATVSYVINGKSVLRAETRDKVFRVMREMNYHPNAVARGLSSKRVHTFGVLFGVGESVEFVTNPYAHGILEGVLAQGAKENFNVTLFTTRWKSAESSASALRDGRTDGVLVVAPPTTSDILSGLFSLNVPLVAISAQETSTVAVVDVDNYAGAKMATQHLLELGHRRIAYIMGNKDMASFAPRHAAFCDALSEAAVDPVPEFIESSHFNGSLAFEQASRMLRHSSRPTAIFAGNDAIALATIDAARGLGLNVPDDLSVIGFDDIPAATLVTPNLTTIRQPLRAIGEVATQRLIERMNSSSNIGPSYSLLQPELIVRGSTAIAPRKKRSSRVDNSLPQENKGESHE